MKSILLLALVVSLAASQAAHYDKVVLQDKDALCLDGTPGVYFLSKGKSPTKFILYFEGGGWCGSHDLASTTESCYQRSKGDLGSSKNYPATTSIGDGILSQNAKNSFADFTKVYFKYCDGSGHQGTRSAPLVYKDTKLYFRGSNLTIATLNDVEKKLGLFSNSTEIMVTGGSAGGLATFIWADYIREKTRHTNVYAVPDSGIFLDSASFTTKNHEYSNSFLNLFKLSNAQGNVFPNRGCLQAFPNATYKCMLAENLHEHIRTPMFPVQSLYDSWSIPNILGIHCPKGHSLANCTTAERNYIEQYHKNTSKVLEAIGKRSQNGYWAPICVDHVYMWGDLYSDNYQIPMHSNNTIDHTLVAWLQKKTSKFIDQGAWPDNKPCSGVTSQNLKTE